MKNFFKKLSFVLAVAMVLTSIAPATASAASKNFVTLKGSNKAITSVTAWIGGVTRNLDYSIDGETSGVKGTWKSSNTDYVKVNAKTGVITPVANGSATVTFTTADGEVAKVAVKARTRAASLNIYDAAEYAAGTKAKLDKVEMTVGEEKELKVTMPMYKKATAAGAKSASYYSYAEVADETVVTVAKNNNRSYTMTAKAAGETTVTIVANQTTQKNVRANKYYVEASFTVSVEEAKAELAAKQSGTNQITVTGSDLSDKVADYTLKLGTATKSLASVSVNEAKTSAVITVSSSTMVEGVYTLTFGEASVEVNCGPSVVTKIVIEPEMAIYETSSSAVAYFKAYNQFDENVTKKVYNDLSVTGSDSVGATSATYNAENEDAKVRFTNTTTGYNLNLSQVSLSIVDKTNGTVCSKVLTVAEESRLKTVEVAGIYKSTGGTYTKVESIPEGINATKLDNYKILLTGVDQYNRAYNTQRFNQNNISLTLSSVTGLSANVAALNTASEEVEIDGVKYAVVDLTVNNSTGKLTAGDVSALGVVLTSGTQFNSTITVAEGVKIASISISAQDGVYGGQDNTLAYTILDTDGNEVTDIDTLCQLNNKDYLKDFPKVKFVGTADGTAKLVYTAASTMTNNTDTLSWISPTLQYGYTSLNIKPDRKPVAIVGIWSMPETAYHFGSELATTSGGAINIPKMNFKYEDQYGNLYQWWENYGNLQNKFSSFTITQETTETPVCVTDKDLTDGLVVTAGAVTASAIIKYKVATEITLPTATNATKNEYEFSIAFAEINDVTGLYAFALADNYYVTSSAAANATVLVGGFYAGKALTLQRADYANIDVKLDTIDPNKSGYDVTLDDTVKVVVNNNEGTVLSVNVKRSNEAAKVVSANAYAEGYAFAGGYATVTHAAVDAAKTADNCVKVNFGDILEVKDQYGKKNGASAVEDATTPRVTFSNLPADTSKYTLVNNGKNNAMLTFTEAGWYTVKATFDWADGYTYSTVLVYEVK